jgi:hypothetical protein
MRFGMFSTEVTLLHHRFKSTEENVSSVDLSSSPVLCEYFQLVLNDLRAELSELDDALDQRNTMDKAPSSKKSKYYSSLTRKMGNFRRLLSAVDRDLPISKLVLAKSQSPEYQRLDGMVKHCLGDCNPTWILCLWDDFKCLLPRPALRSPLPVFAFVIYPESVMPIALAYPILFHEIGHAALSTSADNPGFHNLSAAIDRMDGEYIFRISNAGGGKKRLINEWNTKRCWDLWGRELFCDYFALLAAGPAYLHAMVSYLSGTDPFEDSQSHPPMQLRLDFMRTMSERMGINDVGFEKSKTKWDSMKAACAFRETPMYHSINDPAMIDALIDDAWAITRSMGVDQRNYWAIDHRDSVIGLINTAWEKVLDDEMKADAANKWVTSHLGSV